MEDKDFDNIFGDKLKKQKDFPFSEQKWTVLERQYEQLLAEKRYKRLLLFGSLSLLTLLSGLLWALFSLSNTNKKLDDFTNETRVLQKEKMNNDIPSVRLDEVQKFDIQNQKSDTIFHKIVVYRYDTIYQTVIRRDTFQSSTNLNAVIGNPLNEEGKNKSSISKLITAKPENSIFLAKGSEFIADKVVKQGQQISNPLTPQQPNKDDKGNSNSLSMMDTTNHLTAAKPAIEPIKTSINKQNDSINIFKITSPLKVTDSLSKKVALTKMIPPLSINADSASKNSEMAFEKELGKEEKKQRPIINRIKIKGYELGITGGTAFVSNSNITKQAGYSFGLKGGIMLGRRLQLVSEAQGLNLNFETERFYEKLNIPSITPPTINDDLRSVNASQLYWQFALGLKYQFMDGKRLQPYFGASIVGQATSDEELNYKFINRLTKEDIFIKYKRRGNEFETGILRTTVGVNYRLWSKFQGFLEGGYDFKFDKTPQYKHIGQLKLGLLYRF